MANPLPRRNIALAAVAGLAMLLIAIIVRSFWVSLVLGLVGAAAFAYAAVLLREYGRSLADNAQRRR